MSERPKWMPEEGTVALLHLASDGLREILFKETGLRAQIAVLEEMVPAVCDTCAAGRSLGMTAAGDRYHTGTRFRVGCSSSPIHKKIAALRKELGE